MYKLIYYMFEHHEKSVHHEIKYEGLYVRNDPGQSIHVRIPIICHLLNWIWNIPNPFLIKIVFQSIYKKAGSNIFICNKTTINILITVQYDTAETLLWTGLLEHTNRLESLEHAVKSVSLTRSTYLLEYSSTKASRLPTNLNPISSSSCVVCIYFSVSDAV